GGVHPSEIRSPPPLSEPVPRTGRGSSMVARTPVWNPGSIDVPPRWPCLDCARARRRVDRIAVPRCRLLARSRRRPGTKAGPFPEGSRHDAEWLSIPESVSKPAVTAGRGGRRSRRRGLSHHRLWLRGGRGGRRGGGGIP